MKVDSLSISVSQFGMPHPVEELKEISFHQEILTDHPAPRIARHPPAGYEKEYLNPAKLAPAVGYLCLRVGRGFIKEMQQ
ncbi:hypothetical protein [Shimia sediminis]|uniref:hypothetical protein n=1 Tax=Shimia sediminis TaxID=2497945 RepID=UPI000F8EE04C|nr:hypothetical protein [Shimia sediminis]